MRFVMVLFLILSLTGPARAADAAAESLLAKVRAFVGGDAIDTVQTVHVVSWIAQSGTYGGMTDDARIEYPDSAHSEANGIHGKMALVVTPSDAYVAFGKRRKNLNDAQRETAFLIPAAEVLTVLKRAGTYALTAGGTEIIDGIATGILDISGKSVRLRWWVEESTGRLVRSQRTDLNGTRMTRFSAWKTIAGITVPTTLSITIERSEVTHSLTTVEILHAAPQVADAPRPAPPPSSTPTPAPARDVCETSECSVLVRIMKGDGEPCAHCRVMFTWSGMRFGTGGDAERLTNERGFVEFRSPERYLTTIATIVNKTGLVLPLRFNVDTLGGTSVTITTPYTGR